MLTALMASSATAACTGSSAPPVVSGTASGAVSLMTVTADKPSYKPGDPIVLTASVTSREQHACLVAGVPDGVVTILSITHDGTPVVPTVGEAEYVDGFDDLISGNTASLAPGKSVSIQLPSDTVGDPPTVSLSSASQSSGDQASIAEWSVGQPGKYVVSMVYRMPPVPLPSPACPVSADPVSVTFTVTGSRS